MIQQSTICATTRVRIASVLIAASVALCAGSPAMAQLGKKDKSKSTPTTTTPPKPGQPAQPTAAPPLAGGVAPKSILDDVIKKTQFHDWVLKISIHLDSYQDQPIYTRPGTTTPTTPTGTNQPTLTIIPFKFDTAAVVFPTPEGTATSAMTGAPSASLLFDQRPAGSEPTMIDHLECGARYDRWDMKNKEGRAIDMDVEIPVQTWETIFDEKKASQAIWPVQGKWPKECASALGTTHIGQIPVIDPSSVAVREALNKWTAGKSPQSIPPVQLAKFIASKVLETLQPSGDGLISSQTGLLEGFDLRGPEETLHIGRGSEHDIACTLCSLYRAAGLPARTVIGYDVTETKGTGVGFKKHASGDMRSWVEFALIDENAVMPTTGEAKVVWVPVDVVHQRKSSSVAPPLDKPWKFFGSNPDSDNLIPISFHYHPPLSGVVAHGSPCFWGWMTTPEMQHATQTVRFQANTATKTIAPTGGGGYK